MTPSRTSPQKKARELATLLRQERPDYDYLKKVFFHLRQELDIEVPKASKKLPQVPSDEEMKQFYETVWQAQRVQDALIIKTMLYTGIRVRELVHIKLNDVDLEHCLIRITAAKGGQERLVPFPITFREALALHCQQTLAGGATYLFESSWKKKYSERGIRSMMARYTQAAGLDYSLSPHKLRHYFLLWLKRQGVDDAFIQPISGHATRQALEVYSRLSIQDAQQEYERHIGDFPI